ncbi:hypothetical protein ACQR3P_28735 [Rhodococcus sp. IEGM1300]
MKKPVSKPMNALRGELSSLTSKPVIVFHDYPYKGGVHRALVLFGESLSQKVVDFAEYHLLTVFPLTSGEGYVLIKPKG